MINYVYLSKAFKFLPKNTLKIIDTHDKFSERNNIFPNELRSDFFFTTKEEEARGLSRADLILAISNKEKMFFEKLTSKTIVALPHKIKTTNLVQSKEKRKKIKFGFIGSKNHVNTINLKRFIKIFNSFEFSQNIDFEFNIFGSCTEKLGAEAHPKINYVGYVAEINDFYKSIDCAVIPIFFTTGQNIKLVEAFSFGVPIICLKYLLRIYFLIIWLINAKIMNRYVNEPHYK